MTSSEKKKKNTKFTGIRFIKVGIMSLSYWSKKGKGRVTFSTPDGWANYE